MQPQLINTMEALVIRKLDEVIDRCNCCKCEQCKLDIISYALNQLTAKYVVTHVGSLYAKLEACSLQKETDILAAIMKAIKIVQANPRHAVEVS